VTGWCVGVVIPACNEERLLARCLRSVARAVAESDLVSDCTCVVVVADACADRTVSVATDILAGWGEVVEVDEGNVGRARRAGASRVLERFATERPDRLWLANTDADTTVPRSWLADQLRFADRGIAALAGVVKVDSFGEHPAGVEGRFAAFYGGDTDTHSHVHGANLAVRGDAYLAAGGWPTMDSAEDHALWQAINAGGWPTVATRSVAVTTSGRRLGRAARGFAGFLTALAETA
jgi:glycosyltransferase involved in cell wall biosynthesis